MYIAELDISRSHVGLRFFAHRFREFCRHGTQERDIFREIAVTPCIQFAGDNFSRNLLTAIAFVPVRWRQIFAKSTRAYLSMWAGTHAVWWAAMLGESIDTSIVSQSRVQLIQCQCKSRLQTANLGINNAFNQIVAVWPRCLHPPFYPSQTVPQLIKRAWLVAIPLAVHAHQNKAIFMMPND